jgi:EpsI family protein
MRSIGHFAMLDRLCVFVAAFLAVQAALTHWASGTEHPPSPPGLAALPSRMDTWQQTGENPAISELSSTLHADRVLSRTYYDQQSGSSVELFIAWFQSQRGGASQPHSPKVCLPGAGWTPETSGSLELNTTAGPLKMNRYLVRQGPMRAVVLYWYQTPRRAIAGEWESKFWLIADALRDHRTDTALVRVTALPAAGDEASASVAVDRFSQMVYPLLRSRLPR